MIPDGHTPIDRDGVAALHGLTPRQAARRRPWNQPGHPEPLTRGRPTNSRPRLWDSYQVAAYATGHPAPPLPNRHQPGDLLDRIEAAEYLGLTPTAWERDTYRARVPEPDARPYNVPHWHRSTLDRHAADRARPREPAGGRPAGARDATPRRDLAARVAELVEHHRSQHGRVNIAAIARELGIAYSTAHKYAHSHDSASPPRNRQ
ncbi:hypothetical protein SAMN04487819_11679 [Actinopolyspora alba]|uniref:Uncharacterized protein n=1 Tax=Actinopolyspora alba TaxID=673379 RepID=A0A1I2BG17_9ACTN|nr:hypothetical protein [Actinopolyspora alba]SFE54907.1 hypothetical protein SAMN04487819_11679 [Actinopolyspora alba]